MIGFVDSVGRRWSLRITVGVIRRVRDALGIDLANILSDPEILTQLGRDVVLLVDTLAVVCRPQMDEQGITEEQFAEGLLGDALEQATDALLRGIAEFFPEKKRGVVLRLLDKTAEMGAASLDQAMASIDSLSISGESSTSVPGSADSTPTP